MNEVATEAWLDEAVKAVRADPKVGRGTCSSVDEATTDEELKEDLRKKYEPGMTVEQAVRLVRKFEKIREDYADDIRNA